MAGLISIVAIDSASSPAGGPAPLAHYPLQNNAADATGNNEPMFLLNAPFQNGGVYCNGIYGTAEACDVSTPHISGFNFDSFGASIEFRMDQYPAAEVGKRPIIVCGTDYRYLGAEILTDGKLVILYNNANTSQTVSLGVWHHVLVTYGLPASTGRVYLDGELVDSVLFDLEHGEDANVSVVNFSTGRTFLGTVRHVVVYDSAFDATPVVGTTWGRIKSLM
jgi:hypothetical protein